MEPVPDPSSEPPPARPRLWPILFVLLIAAILGIGRVALNEREKLKAAKTEIDRLRRAAPPSSAKLSLAERTYLEGLAERYGFPDPEAWPSREVLRLAARLNEHLNMFLPGHYNAARTPWLLPPPRTLPGRLLEPSQTVPLDLARGQLAMPEKFAVYQYTLRNTSAAPVPLPLLHQGVRWDAAEALVETAGFRAVKDEVDRAIAIWRWLAEHRVHGKPTTHGGELHDVVKFLSCHGYGFCDDSAQIMAGLAHLCGLKARLFGLEGHVIPEVFAGGKWRMLDPDFAVYFHAPGDPRAILSVAELEKDRAAFSHAVAIGAGGPWDADYAGMYLSRNDNTDWRVDARHAHVVAHTLAPGESVTFSNFNWGRYFSGLYPNKPPRFYNGTFERPLRAADLKAEADVQVRVEGDGWVIENRGQAAAGASVPCPYPFPIVAGNLSGLPAGVAVEYASKEERRTLRPGTNVSLDGAFTQLTGEPTYAFTLRLLIPAGKTVRFEKAPRLVVDFQFAEFALLKLQPGANQFQVHGPVDGVTAEVRWR